MTANNENQSSRAWKPIVVALCVLAAAALSHPVGAVDVCGSVCDQNWIAAQSPYVATCDVTVASGCHLNIYGDVEVRFQAGSALVVDGELNVVGTSEATVTFTSDASSPVPGDWRGLELVGSSISLIDYATVRWADHGIHVNDDAYVALNDVEAKRNNTGLRVEGTGPPTVHAGDCTFTVLSRNRDQ